MVYVPSSNYGFIWNFSPIAVISQPNCFVIFEMSTHYAKPLDSQFPVTLFVVCASNVLLWHHNGASHGASPLRSHHMKWAFAKQTVEQHANAVCAFRLFFFFWYWIGRSVDPHRFGSVEHCVCIAVIETTTTCRAGERASEPASDNMVHGEWINADSRMWTNAGEDICHKVVRLFACDSHTTMPSAWDKDIDWR